MRLLRPWLDVGKCAFKLLTLRVFSGTSDTSHPNVIACRLAVHQVRKCIDALGLGWL